MFKFEIWELLIVSIDVNKYVYIGIIGIIGYVYKSGQVNLENQMKLFFKFRFKGLKNYK